MTIDVTILSIAPRGKQMQRHSMKINLVIISVFFVLNIAACFQIVAQTNGLSSEELSTNIYSLSPNDFRDETWNEYQSYANKVLHGEVIPETLPVSLDTNGNWGSVTNGLQLSLRFRRKEYVIGDVIPAITLLRNLESYPRTLVLTNSESFFLTFLIQRGSNAYLSERIEPIPRPSEMGSGSSEPSPPRGLTSWNWEAKSEKEIVLKLNQIFDLSQTGEYTAKVICRIYSPETKLPLFEVTSGKTSFRVVPKPSSPGQNSSTNSPP